MVKCQPKSKLLRRQKSASEFDGRVAEPGGEDDSELTLFVLPFYTSPPFLGLFWSLLLLWNVPLKTHKKPIQDHGLVTRLHWDLWQDILVHGAPRRCLHQAGSPARTRRQHHWFLILTLHWKRYDFHSDGGEEPGLWETQHLFWWFTLWLTCNRVAVLTIVSSFYGTILNECILGWKSFLTCTCNRGNVTKQLKFLHWHSVLGILSTKALTHKHLWNRPLVSSSIVWYRSLTTKTNIGRSDRREPEDWGGASGRPPHTSVSLHLDSEERAPPASRHLMRRRTQDTLVAVAPSQNALSGDAATPCGTPAHLHVCLFPLCIAYVCSFLVTPHVSSLHQVGFPLEPPLVQQQSASNGQEEGEGETTEWVGAAKTVSSWLFLVRRRQWWPARREGRWEGATVGIMGEEVR